MSTFFNHHQVQASFVRISKYLLPLLLVAAGAVEAASAPKIGSPCKTEAPPSVRPAAYALIRLGMMRADVERILGTPDYSPVEGQDYFSTGGECELEPGRTASCGFIIDYRDYAKDPPEDTGRVMACSWGGIGE